MTSPADLPAVERTADYPVPRHLTPGGLAAFRSEIARFAAGLAGELERQAIATLAKGGQPEHTAEAVEKARRSCLQGLPVEEVVKSQRTARDCLVLAAALLTVATVGLGVMRSYLHSDWQIAAFTGFVVLGLGGLALTWFGRVGRSGVPEDT